jgi:hypothetical protein
LLFDLSAQRISRKVRPSRALKQLEEFRKREEEIRSREQEIAEHEEEMRIKNRNLQRRGTSCVVGVFLLFLIHPF